MNSSFALISQPGNLAHDSITAEHMREEISMAAHDLRNPLACVVSTLELLDARAESALKPEASNVIRRGLRAADRMERMIQRLLHNANPTSGSGIRVARCSVRSAIGAAIEHNALAGATKSISIQMCGGEIFTEIDEHLLVEAIDNLISNAIKFSDPGSKISCRMAREGGSVSIQITDQGPGLSANDLTRLGKPFQRLSAKPTAGEQSIGLGLWSTRRIADALGGNLSAQNNDSGSGATFTLCIPLNHPAAMRKDCYTDAGRFVPCAGL